MPRTENTKLQNQRAGVSQCAFVTEFQGKEPITAAARTAHLKVLHQSQERFGRLLGIIMSY